MKCETCGYEFNATDAKFCRNCGKKTSIKSEAHYLLRQLKGCQLCGSLAQTKKVSFYQNIGMIILRFPSSIEGRLCKKCINREFLKRTVVTFFFGWWGVKSFVFTIFYLISNIINFIPTIGMKQQEY